MKLTSLVLGSLMAFSVFAGGKEDKQEKVACTAAMVMTCSLDQDMAIDQEKLEKILNRKGYEMAAEEDADLVLTFNCFTSEGDKQKGAKAESFVEMTVNNDAEFIAKKSYRKNATKAAKKLLKRNVTKCGVELEDDQQS